MGCSAPSLASDAFTLVGKIRPNLWPGDALTADTPPVAFSPVETGGAS